MIFIVIAGIFYTAALLFITAASRRIDGSLLNGIGNTISAIIPLVIAIPFMNGAYIAKGKTGVIFAVLAGTCIAIFGLALSKSYAVNKVGIVSPLVFGGSIFLTTILSMVFFKEKISVVQGIGLFFVMIGLGFVIYARATGR